MTAHNNNWDALLTEDLRLFIYIVDNEDGEDVYEYARSRIRKKNKAHEVMYTDKTINVFFEKVRNRVDVNDFLKLKEKWNTLSEVEQAKEAILMIGQYEASFLMIMLDYYSEFA